MVGSRREINARCPEIHQCKKTSLYPVSAPDYTLGNSSKWGMLGLHTKKQNMTVASEVARVAGVRLKWLHATAVKCPQHSHIYDHFGDASNPGWGFGTKISTTKISNGPNILVSTALTQLQQAGERKTKRICILFTPEKLAECHLFSATHPYPMQPYLSYTFVLLLWAPSVSSPEPKVPRLPWIHIWKVHFNNDW